MRLRSYYYISIAILLLTCTLGFLGGAHADSDITISLKATPDTIACDGKAWTTITAYVAANVPDGTTIQFTTDLGTFTNHQNSVSGTIAAGAAHAVLVSATSAGTANINAICAAPGNISRGTTQVEFTKDAELALTDASYSWLRVDCSQYLVYSADGKIIQAEGRKGSLAHLHYRSLSIDADGIQVDVQTMQVVARNAILHRDKASLTTAQLAYDLYTSSGTAVLPGSDTIEPKSVTVTGSSFNTVALSAEAADEGVRTHVYGEVDISNSRLVVSAKSIAVNPGVQIQFSRAIIYSDGKKVLALPFHVMPLTTNQLFGEQIVGYTSDGVFLNIPWYYHVSPDSMGTIYIRNSATANSGVTTGLAPSFGASGNRPGLALDLQHTYTLGNGGAGSVVLNSLTRSDWGAVWSHTQRIDPLTNSYFYLDYPEHRGLYGSSSLRRQFTNGYSLSLTGTDSYSPPYMGYSSNSSIVNAYLSSPGKPISKTGVDYLTDLSWQQGRVSENIPNLPAQSAMISTQAADIRFFTTPIHPDKKTIVSDSLTFGDSWANFSGRSSITALGTLGANRTFAKNARASFNYTYSYDPLLANYSQTSSGSPYAILNQTVQQSFSLTGSMTPNKRTVMSMSANYGLPYRNTSLFSTYSYHISNDWGFNATEIYSHAFPASYNVVEFSVSRRILGRTLLFTWGSDTRKIRFDIGAAQF